MKIRFFHMLILGFLAAFAAAQLPNINTQNPNLQNPARIRDPLSSTQPSLFPVPQGRNIPGNDIVNGNVAGGREFRGVVPYNPPAYFEGPTSGAIIDPFLRYSSPANYTTSPNYQPYYSPFRTVTTQQTGIGVVRPPTSAPSPIPSVYTQSATAKRLEIAKKNIATEMMGILPPLTAAQQNLENEVLNTAKNQYTDFIDLSPAQRTELIEKLTKEIGLKPVEEKKETTAPEQNQTLDQKTNFEKVNQIEETKPEIQNNALPQNEQLNIKVKENPYDRTIPEPFEKEKPQQQTYINQKETKEKPEQQKPVDVYQQVQKNVENLKQQQIQPTQPSTQQPGKEPVKSDQLDQVEKLIQKQKEMQAPQTQGTKPTPSVQDQTSTPQTTSPLEKMPTGSALQAQAQNILGQHKDFSSYAQDRFNTHLLLGNKLMEEGHFYRAIDAYTMALVYKPDNVLAMAGKGHALFAAGEYMTAAMFLSDAIELNPQYINTKITVNDMTSNRDTLDARMAEIDQLQQKIDVVELDFLQAYFNYRIGSFGPAQEKIDNVLQKKPGFKAAQILKNAIEAAGKTAK
jgi:tetratricopeptide (TPR) repeat protein